MPDSNEVIDLIVFGRYLRALRTREGYTDADAFIEVLAERYGLSISRRTLYAIERGEQMAHLDLYLAVLAALNPEKGYFRPAIRPDVFARVHGETL